MFDNDEVVKRVDVVDVADDYGVYGNDRREPTVVNTI
jgi:hypothetical protein